jgi:hypothetical protein
MTMSIIKGNLNMMVENMNKCLEEKQLFHYVLMASH